MPIQEEISQRASPNRCDGRDDDDPEEIQPSITRGEHSTHRKDGNAPKIEGMEDHRSSRNAERSGSAAARSAVSCIPGLGGRLCHLLAMALPYTSFANSGSFSLDVSEPIANGLWSHRQNLHVVIWGGRD